MNARAFARQLARESRGARGRLAFFALCLGAGVAGVVAVAGFSAALREGLASEARRLLAGDLRVEGLRPLPEPAARVIAAEPGARVASVRELATVVAAPPNSAGAGRSRLVELRAVEGDFPFYGRLTLDPERPLAELLAGDGAVAAPELLSGLGLAVGDSISVGGRPFRLRGGGHAGPIGAGFGELQLVNLSLTGLDVTFGAGEYTIDLNGEWTRDLNVNLEAGAANIRLRLPSGVGVRVEVGEGPHTAESRGLTKNGNIYTNATYGVSEVRLHVNIEAGIGQINLEVAQTGAPVAAATPDYSPVTGELSNENDPPAPGGAVYEDPQGRFSLPLVGAWKQLETDGSYALVDATGFDLKKSKTPSGCERLADLDAGLVALMALSSRAFALD